MPAQRGRYAFLGKNANITQHTKGKGNRKWAREFSKIICHWKVRKHTCLLAILFQSLSTALVPFAALCPYLKVGNFQLRLLKGRMESLIWFLCWWITCVFVTWTFGITQKSTNLPCKLYNSAKLYWLTLLLSTEKHQWRSQNLSGALLKQRAEYFSAGLSLLSLPCWDTSGAVPLIADAKRKWVFLICNTNSQWGQTACIECRIFNLEVLNYAVNPTNPLIAKMYFRTCILGSTSK